MLLSTNDIVICRVTHIYTHEIRCHILIKCNSNNDNNNNNDADISQYNIRAIIRQHDIIEPTVLLQQQKQNDSSNLTDDIKIPIDNYYQPGDIIRAIVLYNINNTYILSTQDNQYGVILSYSQCGSVMIPLTYNTVQCPITKQIHKRKIAILNNNNNNNNKLHNDTDKSANQQTVSVTT